MFHISREKLFTKENFFLLSLFAAAITIPLKNNLNSLAWASFIIAGLLQAPLHDFWDRLKSSRLWIYCSLYFIWLAFTFFWDVNGDGTIRDIEGYSGLLFLPVILGGVPPVSFRKIYLVCMVFVGTVTILNLVALVKSFIEYQQAGDYRVFFYHYLSHQVGLNAIFLSSYCLGSISWLLYFGYMRKWRWDRRNIFSLVLIGFLTAMVLLLSSKLMISILLLIIFLFITYVAYVKKRLLKGILLVVVILALGLITVKNLHYVRWRFAVTELKRYEGEQDNQNGLAIRLLMWETATELIKERPLLGYGIVGAHEELWKKYREKNFELGYSQRYHSHNQYLETTLMAGIPGLLLLVLILIAVARDALKNKKILLLLILIHFMCLSVVESTFEVQHEFIFFLFFITLFFYHYPQIPLREKKSF
jgi:O-antigen ligase